MSLVEPRSQQAHHRQPFTHRRQALRFRQSSQTPLWLNWTVILLTFEFGSQQYCPGIERCWQNTPAQIHFDMWVYFYWFNLYFTRKIPMRLNISFARESCPRLAATQIDNRHSKQKQRKFKTKENVEKNVSDVEHEGLCFSLNCLLQMSEFCY